MNLVKRCPIAARLIMPVALLSGGCLDQTPGGPELPEFPELTYGGGDFQQGFTFGGEPRRYLVHVPASASRDVAAPVLVVYHGALQTAADIRAVADIEGLSDPRGYVVIYPEGLLNGWAVGSITTQDLAGIDDVGFTRALIGTVNDDLNIDPGRVFVAGFSNGGMMVHRLACQASDVITAVASVGATMLENISDDCAPTRSVSMLFFLGTADPSFPFDGRVGAPELVLTGADETLERWAELDGCDRTPIVTALADIADDGTTVELRDYPNCAPGADVDFYVIESGGHTWPGSPIDFGGALGPTTRDISASQIMLDFFGGLP